MKRKVIFGIAFFALIATVSTNSIVESQKAIDLTLSGIETMAAGESSTPCPGFKRETKYFNGTPYVCCVNGTYMDGCVFGYEDSKCNQFVVRNPKPSGC